VQAQHLRSDDALGAALLFLANAAIAVIRAVSFLPATSNRRVMLDSVQTESEWRGLWRLQEVG
jgi:hypothetical protein